MGKKKQYSPRRVRSEEERGSGSSDFIMLDEGEKFLGYALFSGDPADDEPGYYEFLQHWDQGSKRSIPCAGEDCPLCEDGDKPRDVANTLWLVTKDERGNVLDPPQLRIFKANSLVIKQLTEKRSEDDQILGMLHRVSRIDDRGGYVLEAKGKTLGKKEIKETLKDPSAPDFDQMVTSQLNRAMEAITIARALDDDDDDPDEDDDEPKDKKKADKKESKSKKGGKKSDPESDDDDNEWPDDGLDEVTVTVKKVDKGGDFITVEHDDYEGTKNVYTNNDIEFDLTDLSKGDEVTISATGPDDEGDYILSEEPSTDEPEAEAEKDDDDDGDKNLPDAIEDEEFVITSIDTTESTMEVESEELELSFTLYFLDKGPASEVDFDDFEEGDKINLSAEQDSQGDMVATAIPEKVKKKSGGKKESGKKGGSAKGGKKK